MAVTTTISHQMPVIVNPAPQEQLLMQQSSTQAETRTDERRTDEARTDEARTDDHLPDFSPEQPPAYNQLQTTTTASSRYARRPSIPEGCSWMEFRSRMLNQFDPRLWSWIWVAKKDPRHISSALTPEHWASAAGDIANVLPRLDKDGKKVSNKSPARLFKGSQQLCLHVAAAFGRLEVVKVLLASNSCEVDYQDNRDQTALYIACRQNETEVAQLLLNAGWSSMKFPSRHPTSLDMAIESDNEQLVEMLLLHGASVEFFNARGKYPLHLAARSSSPRILSLLIEHNARMEASSSGLQLAPLHIAAANYNVSAIYTLLRHGANVNIEGGHDRKTSLHVAVGQHVEDPVYSRRKIETIHALIDHGADLNAVDKFDRSILHYAVSIRPLSPPINDNSSANVIFETVELLLDNHAEINAAATAVSGGFVPLRRTSWTPLHEAAFSGESAVIRALLSRGIKATMRDGEGRTPLDAAVDRYFQRLPKETKEAKQWRETQAIDAVQTLLDCGADATMCLGWSPGLREDPGDASVVLRVLGEQRRLSSKQSSRFSMGGSSSQASSSKAQAQHDEEYRDRTGLPEYTQAR